MESFAGQPGHVYFSHMAVLNNNKKAECLSCHGDKAASMTTGRLKGKMRMSTCENCHTKLNISKSCIVCHD